MWPHSTVNCEMFREIGGLSESFGANRAGVGTHAAVNFSVLCHATGQGKRFPAFRTNKGPLAQMCTLVAEKRQGFVEGFATLLAEERLVVGVHVALMFPQVRGAHKILSTFLTDVRLLSGVCSDVFAEVRGPNVAFLTKRALVRSFACVEPLVLLKSPLVRVGLPAHVANMWFKTAVSIDVAQQVAGLFESPVAVSALVRTVFRVSLYSSLPNGRKHYLIF